MAGQDGKQAVAPDVHRITVPVSFFHPQTPGLSRVARAMHRILNKIFRHRDIVIDNELYLRRWFITPRSWPLRLFLHCILRPDEETFTHNHPWPFATLVLAGGYDEQFLKTVTTREFWRTKVLAPTHGLKRGRRFRFRRRLLPGALVWNSATHAHAVAPYNGTVWTLVCAGKSEQDWGFHTETGWVDWRTHLGLPAATPDHPEDKIRRRSV